MMFRLCLIAALAVGTRADALDLPGNARLTAERVSENDRYAAPIGVFDGSAIPSIVLEGQVRRQAWQVPGRGLTPLQILAPLRAELEAAGFTNRLECSAEQCGGFDFRFGTDVLPAPAMFVALQNFQFLTMTSGPADRPERATTLFVSTTRDAAYLQIIDVVREGGAFARVATTRPVARNDTPVAVVPEAGDFLSEGSMVLDGVDFESGQTQLGEAVIPSLEQLAGIMADNPGLRIALVGHTDSVGALDGNIAISRQRARAVRAKLIADHGVASSRLEAEGMGYLAPRASNLTEAGREANRRVEAIVLSLQE
jgi:OOP family OmpA-OmpF porin